MRCRPFRHDWSSWAYHWIFFSKWRDRHCIKCGKEQTRHWDG